MKLSIARAVALRRLPVLLIHTALIVAIAGSQPRACADELAYDVAIRNARIVDGAGNPWFYGDVAIRGDRIVAVGRVPQAKAKREIDAKGLIVAPGFIDMHSHSD